MSKVDSVHVYQELAKSIRARFDTIHNQIPLIETYYDAEAIAYQARKITEAIGYLTLIAFDNKFKKVPKECKGKYKPHDIFNKLIKMYPNQNFLPFPSIIQEATPAPTHSVR